MPEMFAMIMVLFAIAQMFSVFFSVLNRNFIQDEINRREKASKKLAQKRLVNEEKEVRYWLGIQDDQTETEKLKENNYG